MFVRTLNPKAPTLNPKPLKPLKTLQDPGPPREPITPSRMRPPLGTVYFLEKEGVRDSTLKFFWSWWGECLIFWGLGALGLRGWGV